MNREGLLCLETEMPSNPMEKIQKALVRAWVDHVVAEAVTRRFPMVILRHWDMSDFQVFEAVAIRAQIITRLQYIHSQCASEVVSELLRRVNGYPNVQQTFFNINIRDQKYSVTVSRDGEAVLLSINDAGGKAIYP